MAVITPHLLKSISQKLSRVPADPADLPVAVAQLAPQLDGLERLDELELLAVEPATLLLPSAEGAHGA